MTRPKRKPKKGKVYLLKAMDEDGLFIYKYGSTTQINTKQRIRSANSKLKLKFEEIATFDVIDVFARENEFMWFFTCSWRVERYNFNFIWIEDIYTRLGETFVSDCGIDEDLINIMREICHG